MRHARWAGVMVALLGAALHGHAADDAEKAKLKGAWVPVSMKQGGKDAPERTWNRMRLTFQEDKLLWKGNFPSNPEREDALKYGIDASKTPKEMDIFTPDGRPMSCIYAISGDELKICIGQQRPTELDSKEGSRTVLLTLKRSGK